MTLLAAGAGLLYLLREQPFDLSARQQRDLSLGDGVVVYPLR